jgi:hypothetical protein
MFLGGGFSRLAIDSKAAGDMAKASSYGAAAASMIFIFTSAFGASWLTVPWYGTSPCLFYSMLIPDFLGCTRLKSSPWPFVPVEMLLVLWDGVSEMDGW